MTQAQPPCETQRAALLFVLPAADAHARLRAHQAVLELFLKLVPHTLLLALLQHRPSRRILELTCETVPPSVKRNPVRKGVSKRPASPRANLSSS